MSDPHKTQDREPVFSPELGLAIVELPEGYSLADLWQISWNDRLYKCIYSVCNIVQLPCT